MKPTIIIGLIALFLAGCAGRAPNPVAVVQTRDEVLSCSSIKSEIYYNNKKINDLVKEKNWKLAQNIGAGVGTIFFLPAAFLLDLQGTQNVEMNALNDRQHRLADLALIRCRS